MVPVEDWGGGQALVTCFKFCHYYHTGQSDGAMAQGSGGENERLLGGGENQAVL